MASKYRRGKLLGEGTWGRVFEGIRISDNSLVAIKRIDKGLSEDVVKKEGEEEKKKETLNGINFTALREIKYLRELKSPYIIKLEDVFLSDKILHLVLEYAPYDLRRVIYEKNLILRPQHIKSYMKMFLLGMEYLHKNFVLHRDLSPANLLIGEDGLLKLADFGLARSHGSPNPMTSLVVTRWYRAPELLFGSRFYSSHVDMWAVGCIFGELINRCALFQGNTDQEQLAKIFNVLGTPTEENWPDVTLLPQYIEFETREPLNLITLFKPSNESDKDNKVIHQDLDLLLKMLSLNPNQRITASQALKHPYFSTAPEATPPEDLPLPAGVTINRTRSRHANEQEQEQEIKKIKIEV